MIYWIISKFARSRTIVSCIGIFIYCKTVSFCRKILTVLGSGRPIGKWSSMLPNVTLWEWLGITHTNKSFMTTLCISKLWKTFSPRNILVLQSQRTWIGVNISLISRLKQLRLKVSFEGTRLSHLGVLRRLHTKLWYALNWSMQPPFGALIVKLRFNKWRRYRGRQPAGPAGGGATLVVLEKCSMSCNGQLWRPGGISPLCFSSTRLWDYVYW